MILAVSLIKVIMLNLISTVIWIEIEIENERGDDQGTHNLKTHERVHTMLVSRSVGW